MTDDLLKRLRKHVRSMEMLGYYGDGPMIIQAADELERLRAERTQLIDEVASLTARVIDDREASEERERELERLMLQRDEHVREVAARAIRSAASRLPPPSCESCLGGVATTPRTCSRCAGTTLEPSDSGRAHQHAIDVRTLEEMADEIAGGAAAIPAMVNASTRAAGATSNDVQSDCEKTDKRQN